MTTRDTNDNEPQNRSINQMAGRVSDDERLTTAERRILQRLGVAVLTRWNDLPVDVQRKIFKAASDSAMSAKSDIPAQIARFLHDHKDDTGAPHSTSRRA